MSALPGRLVGELNGNWRGGRTLASNGYILVRVGKDHPLADCRGYAYEHRLVAEEMLGRPLLPTEIVHHKDGNTTNNVASNLAVLPSIAAHHVEHRTRQDLRLPGESNPRIECECGCGSTLDRFDRWGRPRRFISGHNTRGSNGRF